MKYRILIIIGILTFWQSSIAQQSIDEAIAVIESNNPILKALKSETDAEIIGNRTGLYPANPEAGFNYLWGSPEVINDRKDFSIMQSFDFPTAYFYRSRIAGLKNEQAALSYSNRRMEILKEAYGLCAGLVYHNAVKALLTERVGQAKELAGIYQRRLENGDANILESNKAQLNLLTVSRKYESNELERNALLAELRALNGGKDIVLNTETFPAITLDPDFEKWYASAEALNPEIQWLSMEQIIAGKQVQLNKALWLPQLSAGYMSEAVPGETFRGISVGVSVPLWQNRNTVKYARARSLAAAEYATGRKVMFRTGIEASHSKVLALQKDVESFRADFSALGNTALIEKALNSGQISLAEYLLELTYYYEAADQLLQLEYELAKAYAELVPYRK